MPWDQPDNNLWLYALAGLAAVLVLYVAVRTTRRRQRRHPDLESGQREDLAEYPPAPEGAGTLDVSGIPVRLRLVVVAPTASTAGITADDVPELLENVLRGLGSLVSADKPRVKVWPTPLSVTGFAPTFHRLVASPDNRWIKLAGPARTRRGPILLGLALYADEPSNLGDIVVEPTEWRELLRVER